MYYFRYKVLKWLFSGAGPVTLDTLSLLEDAAERDADGEEEDGGGDAGGRIVVLDAAAAVGAVVPANTTSVNLVPLRSYNVSSVVCLSQQQAAGEQWKTETFLVSMQQFHFLIFFGQFHST